MLYGEVNGNARTNDDDGCVTNTLRLAVPSALPLVSYVNIARFLYDNQLSALPPRLFDGLEKLTFL